jgi:hypothetical protein
MAQVFDELFGLYKPRAKADTTRMQRSGHVRSQSHNLDSYPPDYPYLRASLRDTSSRTHVWYEVFVLNGATTAMSLLLLPGMAASCSLQHHLLLDSDELVNHQGSCWRRRSKAISEVSRCESAGRL